MFDWDAVIIGAGPAGLTAGLYLSRGKRRCVALEKENFGGTPLNVEMIENYPGFAEGVAGAKLTSDMLMQATRYGLQVRMADVTGIELFPDTRWVKCADGSGFTSAVVIIAGGARRKKIGVPGERELEGKGVFNCALCDGGQFVNKVVAVCGGGDAGVTEALYMTKLASKVYLLEFKPSLTACEILKERVSANPKIEVHCGVKVDSIVGTDKVEGIRFQDVSHGNSETIKTDGVLVHIGLEANTGYLGGIVPLDNQGQIIVDQNMQTGVPFVLAAGDIRSHSPRQIVTAVGDGATAAIAAEKLLQQLNPG